MTCNLLNHEKDLKNAFNTVSSSTTGDQWCIFEYDGNSNIVKLGNSGESGGLEGMIEQLNSGKIQYGFATTSPANSTQRKIILIHWQGEGVPAARLASTAAHAEEIRRFVRLVHLTIYARSEEDVESCVIAKLLASKLSTDCPPQQLASHSQPSSTANSNKSSVITPWVPPTPVGTDYCPTKPAKDIDMDERTKFWTEMRAEEENRRREEVQRKEEQQKIFAEERRQLESQLHKTHLDKATAKVNGSPQLVKTQSVDSSTKKGKLIAGRTQMFEQKVAEIVKSTSKPMTKAKNFKFQVGVVKTGGQDQQVPVNRQPEPTVVECSFERRPIGKLNGGGSNPWIGGDPSKLPPMVKPDLGGNQKFEPEPLATLPKVSSDLPSLQPTQIPILPVHPVYRKEPEVIKEEEEPIDLAKKNNQLYDGLPKYQTTEKVFKELSESVVGGGGQTIRAKALWDYQAEDDTEISFDPDDIITDVQMIHDGWWKGRNPHGIVGLFPSNYVQLL